MRAYENRKIYIIRFWNKANENIMVDGSYSFSFETFAAAWDNARLLLEEAYAAGAVEMDINNTFYTIKE